MIIITINFEGKLLQIYADYVQSISKSFMSKVLILLIPRNGCRSKWTQNISNLVFVKYFTLNSERLFDTIPIRSSNKFGSATKNLKTQNCTMQNKKTELFATE